MGPGSPLESVSSGRSGNCISWHVTICWLQSPSLEVAICLAKDAVEQRCNSSHASGTKWYTLPVCERERMPLLRYSPLGPANSEGWLGCRAACEVLWKMTVYLLLSGRQEALSSLGVFKLFIFLWLVGGMGDCTHATPHSRFCLCDNHNIPSQLQTKKKKKKKRKSYMLI